MKAEQTRSVFAAIVGRPNVGKSTLLNRLVGEKVAIVTPKPQTTRTRITGVLTKNETQMVFIDTPGFHSPKSKLSEYMIKKVRESVCDVDVAVIVTEALGEIRENEKTLLESIVQRNIPALLVINKIDALEQKELMLEKIAAFSKLHEFSQIIPISALTGDGVDILLEKISAFALPGPHYFDRDDYTDQPERAMVAETVREKLLLSMSEEVPHGIAVVVEEMKEREDKELIDISVNIYCEKMSHKGMVIGKGGEMLKKIGSSARRDIEAFLGVPVNLQCWVKVKEDWRNRDGLLKEFGLR